MRHLIEITSHSELTASIMQAFTFMAVEDSKDDFDFNDLYKKASNHFLPVTDDIGMIMTEQDNVTLMLTKFLKEWECVFDVTAIQQNIHYHLLVMDKN